MPFEPSANTQSYKLQKTLTTQKIDLPVNIMSNGVVVKQVLSINALPNINNIITTNGNADISGGAVVKVLVLDADKQYKLLEENINFNAHISDADIIDETKIYAVASLNEVKNIIASENSVSFNVVINVDSYLIKNQTINYVQSLSPDVCQKTCQHEFLDVNYSTSQNFDVINEVNLPNSISSVLLSSGSAIVEDCKTSIDVITLSGKVFASVVYLTNEEVPKLKTQDYVLDYTQEILANSTLPDDSVVAQVKLNNIIAEVQGELNSSKGVLSLKSNILVNAFTTRKSSIEVLEDAFCPKYELIPENTSYTNQNYLTESFNEKIDGNLSLTDDVRIDKILCVSHSYITHNITKDKDNQTTINGVVLANVIYQLDDDNLTTGAILAEIPFTKTFSYQNIDNINTIISVKEIEARSKRVKDIDIQVAISIMLNYSQNVENNIVSNITLGKKIEEVNKPMGVYIVSSVKSLWDIAKMLKVAPSVITEQNPNLTFPITQPTNVLVYRQNI